MNYDIVSFTEATRSARSLAQSALPDAPVIDDFRPKNGPSTFEIVRRRLSNGLHGTADRVAPASPALATESSSC
jgi:hypothetical protein